MTIAKPLKDSSLQQSRKKQFLSWNNHILALLPSMLLAGLLGTYLDLYFVGIGLYSFPTRLFPEIFPIHIGFTLFCLPVFTIIFLLVCRKFSFLQKGFFILLLSLFISVMEKLAESIGVFTHHDSWKHIYSFFGYMLYLIMIYGFYHCLYKYLIKQ